MFTCVPPRERGEIEEDGLGIISVTGDLSGPASSLKHDTHRNSSLPCVNKPHEVPQARLIQMVTEDRSNSRNLSDA